jgi:hypothetical protein
LIHFFLKYKNILLGNENKNICNQKPALIIAIEQTRMRLPLLKLFIAIFLSVF